ncbi:conjugal transfer protein TraN [Glaesserella parasuis]|nr:mating pair stabilization TraN family protein [Glaesserella parasuis 174]MCT8756557.1 conjugal transfer protein TraN [Glaesserella parasuis]MDD2170372.1 conjugal transfer protein TraN [Glaesserella parasuis]MDO9767936.1 conjugal transfer protein TraN [Glaesserella parasuis]MDO9922511.1 conjugal transfer protein TraN [Glaesserella parasuis]
MKYHQWLVAIIAGFSLSVTANTDMSKSFNEAREVGKSNNSNAQSILRDFQPTKELDNFQSRPTESGYYQGITGNPDLSSKGMQSLNTSEIGKSIRESTINNPKVDISEESDFIQNSNNIRKNAAAISGMTNSKQCVKQVLSKTNFTYHYCEKDNAIQKMCKTVANVTISGEKKVIVDKLVIQNTRGLGGYAHSYTYLVLNGFRGSRWKWDVPVNINQDGRMTKVTIALNKNRVKFGPAYGRTHTIVFNGEPYDSKGTHTLDIPVDIHLKKGIPYIFTFWGGRQFDSDPIIYDSISFTIEKEVNTLKANVDYVNSCTDDEIKDAIKVEEKCVVEGGTRTFIKDGESVQAEADCWEKSETFVANDASDNECIKYEKNPNCTISERECILKEGNDCVRHRIKYQCSTTVKTDGYICGDKFFCSDGSCSDLEGSVNSDFGHAVSQLATLAQAGKDVSLDDVNLRAFSGRPMYCRKSGFGFSDCCKDSGWGNDAGLAKCNSEENALGKAKDKKLTIFVGTYCDKRVLKKCVRRKSSYCVFDNKLARIIQAQGRSGQLGMGFGGASSPDCRGLNVDELQRIDFNAMDYSDFYEELEANKQIPDKDQLIEYMRKSITNQLQQ